MTVPPPRITQLLQQMNAGDRSVEPELLAIVYSELRELAAAAMSRESPGHTLQATALVNEVWAKLAGGGLRDWNDSGHFLRVAARAMRNVLVDHARARSAQKRGNRSEAPPEFVEQMLSVYDERALDVIALHDALERLSEVDPELARLVELRYFAGLSIDETAGAIGESASTVDRRWRLARAWLRQELTEE